MQNQTENNEKFSDESDRASFIELAAVNFKIEQAKLKANQKDYEATGVCLNCETPLSEGIRFCDKDCMDDYEKRRGVK